MPMDSAQVHKIIKARQYAEEPRRFHLDALTARVDGDDRTHQVELKEGAWSCDCEFFEMRGTCAHTMALERHFGEMLEVAV
jgi:hypothetical protein